MCWICDHPGATERDYTEHMRRLITAYGWAVQGVERDGIHPPWAYTVGLTSHRRPELVITGMGLTRATKVLNGVAADLLHAGPPEPGRRVVRRPDQRPAARARRQARELALGQRVPGRPRRAADPRLPGAGRAPQAGRVGALCKTDPGASSRTSLASMGLLGPCEWPVPGYGENHSGNLDDASIKATRCR